MEIMSSLNFFNEDLTIRAGRPFQASLYSKQQIRDLRSNENKSTHNRRGFPQAGSLHWLIMIVYKRVPGLGVVESYVLLCQNNLPVRLLSFSANRSLIIITWCKLQPVDHPWKTLHYTKSACPMNIVSSIPSFLRATCSGHASHGC